MGFAAQLHEILKQLGEERQTALFSATLPKQLVEFTRAGLKDPVIIRLDAEAKLSPNLKMTFFTLRRDQKSAALLILLREQISKDEQTIVFAATRHHVEYLQGLLQAADIPSVPVYGQLDPAARKINLAKFRTKKCGVLLVTDVAARGIDIPLLDNVINYDFPCKPKLFVHRAGRVARAGRNGNAFTLVAPDELPYMIDLHLFFGLKLRNELITDKEKEGAEAQEANPVYYGNFPRDVLEIEDDAVKALRRNHGLTKQFETSERAYQQYNKTREGASTASAQRAKELPPSKLHPMFAMKQSDNDRTVDVFLEGIRGYKSHTTIFEVKQLNIKGGSEAMRVKREMHDLAIAKRKEQQERDEAIKRQQEEMKVNYGKKKVDKSDLPDFDHSQDDDLNEDEEDEDEDEAEDEEDDDADSNGEDDEFDVDDGEDDEMEVDDDGEDSSVRSHPSGSKGQKRKATSEVPAAKVRLSKKQRQLLKKAAKSANASSAGSDEDNEDDDHGDDNSDDDTDRPRGRVAAAPSTSGLTFRDPKFFISSEPSDASVERGLSLGESRSTRLEDMVMELGGDDEQAFAKARAVHTWDARKRNYVRTMVGGDPFKVRQQSRQYKRERIYSRDGAKSLFGTFLICAHSFTVSLVVLLRNNVMSLVN